MPTVIFKNILDIEDGIIVHQINPFVMGAGLAKQIRYRYPKHYEDFLHWKKTRKNVWLGHIVITTHYEPLYIVGMCAQEKYGFARKEYTDYDAFKECLKSVDYLAIKYSKKLYVPFGIGCGLAGGDWRYILHYITETTPYAIICKLGKPTQEERDALYGRGKIHI